MARRYSRDNRGRFSSAGATARGGRLATASGNKRATQTAKLSGGGTKGTVSKPKGLKPQDSGKLRKGVAYNRLKGINAKMGDRPDLAQVNIKGRFTGQAGKRMDASLDKAVNSIKSANRAESRARNSQFKSDQSRAKALRTAHVGAIAKAKGLSKGQVETALKAQSPSVQIKALKNWVRDNRKGARK